MSLESAIEKLADAILTLAATGYRTAIATEANDTPAPAAAKRGPGRPPKVTPESPAAPAVATEPSVDVTGATGTPKAAEPQAPAPSPPAAITIDKPLLQRTLIEVVQKKGRDACGALCRAHGGGNLSALDAAVYPALYADARALLATDE